MLELDALGCMNCERRCWLPGDCIYWKCYRCILDDVTPPKGIFACERCPRLLAIVVLTCLRVLLMLYLSVVSLGGYEENMSNSSEASGPL